MNHTCSAIKRNHSHWENYKDDRWVKAVLLHIWPYQINPHKASSSRDHTHTHLLTLRILLENNIYTPMIKSTEKKILNGATVFIIHVNQRELTSLVDLHSSFSSLYPFCLSSSFCELAWVEQFVVFLESMSVCWQRYMTMTPFHQGTLKDIPLKIK